MFWSLLAVPTLTILISNMGDTVVKAVKDFTIWVGEVTVLPAANAGPIERLRYGLYKSTFGKIDMTKKRKQPDDQSDDDAFKTFQEANPGLIHMYRPDERGSDGEDLEAKEAEQGQRLAAEFEESERLDEKVAKLHGDLEAQGRRYLILSRDRPLTRAQTSITFATFSLPRYAKSGRIQ